MTSDFLIATFFNLGLNIIQTLIALVVAVLGLQFIDRKLLKAHRHRAGAAEGQPGGGDLRVHHPAVRGHRDGVRPARM